MTKHAKKHKIKEKLQCITENQHMLLAQDRQQQYEEVVELQNQGWKYADKKCRKLPMGEVPFSPVLNQAGAAIELWKGVKKKKLRCKFSMEKI